MRKVLFFILLLGLPTLVFGQNSNYKSGYIITNNKDTIFGLIDFRTDSQNSKMCKFKTETNALDKVYYPGDIYSYYISYVGKYYVSHAIDIDGEKQTVFLEYLVEGIMNLYYYDNITNSQKYYFFENQEGKMYSITKRPDSITSNYKIVPDNDYKGYIHYIFKDCESIALGSYDIDFKQKSMIDVTKKYHKDICKTGEPCIVYQNQKPDYMGYKTKFSVYGGLQQSDYAFVLNTEGTSFYSSKTLSPVFGVQMNILNPRWSKSFSLQLDVSGSYFKGKTGDVEYFNSLGFKNYYKYDYDMMALSGRIGGKYTFVKYRVRPTAEFGLVYTRLFNISTTKYEGRSYKDGPIDYYQSGKDYIIKDSHLGYYVALGADYVLEKEHAVFVRIAFEQYEKTNKYLINVYDYIKTPHIKLGYTF